MSNHCCLAAFRAKESADAGHRNELPDLRFKKKAGRFGPIRWFFYVISLSHFSFVIDDRSQNPTESRDVNRNLFQT